MEPETIIIRGATILAGDHLEPTENAAVAISQGRITKVGSHVSFGSSDATMSFDATGLLLIPGFIDAHVHIGFFEPIQLLRGGVTTVRDLAWPAETIFPLAEASTAADFEGPRILAAGPMLTVPNGYPERAGWAPRGTGAALESADQARTLVDSLARRGAAVIKIALNPAAGPVLDDALLQAIVDAAHAHGFKVTGHISGLDQLKRAIAAGVDELAHMLMSDDVIPDRTLASMVEADMTVIPTLSIRSGADRAKAVDNLRRFIAVGGRVVYGTDLGNEGPGPGIDRNEVLGMADAGMGTRDIVVAATVVAAEWLGLERTGVIEQGADADLVAVPGAALDDPALLSEVVMVLRRGRRIR